LWDKFGKFQSINLSTDFNFLKEFIPDAFHRIQIVHKRCVVAISNPE
jgi:hypothetical protein